MKKRKGFTLIELLVVIAIIGILAAIVVVSTRAAIAKGKDAQVQAAINQVRSVAEMIMNDRGAYNDNGGNQGLCDNTTGGLNTDQSDYGSQLTNIVNQVTSAGGEAPRCNASIDKYCVAGRLATKAPGNQDKYFCVDNTGLTTTTVGNTCDSTNYDCQ